MTYDESLDIKPAKTGSKSVSQFPLTHQDSFDTKSEAAVAKSNQGLAVVAEKVDKKSNLDVIN